MLDYLVSPWVGQFDQLIDSCRTSLLLCSPYVSRGPCNRVIARLGSRQPPIDVHLLTDLSTDNLVSGATDPAAVLALTEQLPAVTVRYLPRLHAKVYVSDFAHAVVTSGNLTDGGLIRNREYGVRLSDVAAVTQIRNDMLHLAALASVVSVDKLRVLVEATTDLRARRKSVDASQRAELRKAFDDRVVEVNEELLRVRTGGRSLDAVLSDTILYVLRSGPLTTQDIHREVQRIHPDLCDDSVDRVINGQHFGKKWKHAVRSAQAKLKQKGRLILRENRWDVVS